MNEEKEIKKITKNAKVQNIFWAINALANDENAVLEMSKVLSRIEGEMRGIIHRTKENISKQFLKPKEEMQKELVQRFEKHLQEKEEGKTNDLFVNQERVLKHVGSIADEASLRDRERAMKWERLEKKEKEE